MSLSCLWHWIVSGHLEAMGKNSGGGERKPYSGNTGRPSDAVEGLAEDRRALLRLGRRRPQQRQDWPSVRQTEMPNGS